MNIPTKYIIAVAFSALMLSSTALMAAPSATTEPVAVATPKMSMPTYTKPYIGQMQQMTASYEDTLVHVGREYGVGFVEMRAANPSVDPWLPGAGTQLIIPTLNILPDAPHEGVVVNLAEMRLYYYKTPNSEPITFPIGIGRDGLKTPLGPTTVTRKKAGPTWTPTERMRKEDPTLPVSVPPGPENPMGTNALYLGFPTIAIHGTNKPYGIGRRVSSGCIRLFPEDITQMFDMTPVGTKVTVVDQSIKAAWIGDRFFLEVHPTQDQAAVMEHEGSVPDYQLSERDLSYIMRVAGKDVQNLDWQKIRTVVKERKGYPIPIATKTGELAKAQ